MKTKIETEQLSFSYHRQPVLRQVSVRFAEQTLSAIVGPSGIGKSTFLAIFNRLWEHIPGGRMSGTVRIRLDGAMRDIYHPTVKVDSLRRRVGMVFQAPNPLPMSIFRNIAFPLRLAGHRDRHWIAGRVEQGLRDVVLWEEVKDRLDENALALSGGQQQRLCLARALVLDPEVLLLDEPTSSLDARSGAMIEELLCELKKHCTLLLVSHYLDQVKRIADAVFELSDGQLVAKG